MTASFTYKLYIYSGLQNCETVKPFSLKLRERMECRIMQPAVCNGVQNTIQRDEHAGEMSSASHVTGMLASSYTYLNKLENELGIGVSKFIYSFVTG